jgi:hypothetical protein
MGKLVVVMPETKELPWLERSVVPPGATLLTDPRKSLLGADAKEVVSDSGELRRNWEQGVFTVNTPQSQAAMGWIGGKALALPDVDIAISTRNATVAVQSLDGDPIRTSRNILISLAARSVPGSANQMPYFSEPVEGTLTVRAPKGLKLYKSRPASGALQQVPVPYRDGRYLVALNKTGMTYWLFLK